ncbi:hypothetical protein F4861DRAFT_517100 [Xylaria intraflava]|nr:hypothetical protein F4861DRAFT_517100 [Xylaria intraflava]
MTQNPVMSVHTEDSQASHNKLLFLMQEHGVGVETTLGNNKPQPSIQALISVPSSAHKSRQHQHVGSAFDASAASANRPNSNVDANSDPNTNEFTSPVKRSSQRRRRLRSTASAPCDSHFVDNSHGPLIQDDALSRSLPTKPSKTRTRTMPSQSPTQSNHGRSYEQYDNYNRDGSQPSSPPGSLTGDRRTLHEGDTGYVNLKSSPELPDTAPFDLYVASTEDKENTSHDRSHSASQTATRRASRSAPETPTTFPSKSFLSCGNEQLIAPSQLFGQTQPTSGLKKASPTSSRPSPNILRNNLTSPTNPISSPLKAQGLIVTSSPDCASTSPNFPEHCPRPPNTRTSESPSPGGISDVAEDRDGVECDKTSFLGLNSRKTKTGLEPIDEYRPYRGRGLRDSARRSSQTTVDSDFERDEEERRRQRAKLIKKRATRSFPEISVPFPNLGKSKVEVPSTNRAKRSSPRNSSEEHVAQGNYAPGTDDSQETVADSQDTVVQPQPTNRSGNSALPTAIQGGMGHGSKSLGEIIPGTDPFGTLTEPLKPINGIKKVRPSTSSGLPALSFPPPSLNVMPEPLGSFNRSQSEPNGSVATVMNQRRTHSIVVASSPPVVIASSQQNPTHRVGDLSRPVTPELIIHLDPDTTPSTLTVLSTPPSISSNVVRSIEDDHEEESPDTSITVPRPTAVGINRRADPSLPLPDPSSSLPRPKSRGRPRPTPRKGVRQSSRHGSLSLDELDNPNVSGAAKSLLVTRKPSRKPTTLREFQAKRGLFEGMVFAISFQERQQPKKCKDKLLSKSSLEDLIRQGGGKILDDGFNSLFEFDTLSAGVKSQATPVLSNSLKLRDDMVGFAALIADGHSRKVKYMQALALGIPCLAPRWVTTCVSKKEIVDWPSYLLCAGSSTLLGDAIRSRNLMPYDASTAKLAEVISRRAKMLDGSKILLIMNKTKNDAKRIPYVFLAQVLGASLVRVHKIEEARAKLREAESKQDGFDWVYVDDQVRDAKTALFGTGSGEKCSKKRGRRSSTTGMGDGPPPKRIRTLNDELVIQSLILGRLIEEDEMEE